jgi:NAD(P) transhydrogenase
VFDEADLKLLGVHVIGEQACELVHIGLLALMSGGGAKLFLDTCFNYPTLGDLYKLATHDALIRRAQQAGRVPKAAVS